MKRFFRLKRSVGVRQRLFDFLDRSRRRQRSFKLAILGLTCLAIALVFGVLPKGRYVAAAAQSTARQAARTEPIRGPGCGSPARPRPPGNRRN